MAYNVSIKYGNTEISTISGTDNTAITYNGTTISNTFEGTKTLITNGKLAASNITVGSKILTCANKLLNNNITVISEKSGLNYGDGSKNNVIGGYNSLLKLYVYATGAFESFSPQSYSGNFGNIYADSGCNITRTEETILDKANVSAGDYDYTFTPVTGDGITTYRVHLGAGGLTTGVAIGNFKICLDGTYYLMSEAIAAGKIQPLVVVPQSWNTSGNCWQQILSLYNSTSTIATANYPESPWLIVLKNGVVFSGIHLYSNRAWNTTYDGLRVYKWTDKTICLGN